MALTSDDWTIIGMVAVFVIGLFIIWLFRRNSRKYAEEEPSVSNHGARSRSERHGRTKDSRDPTAAREIPVEKIYIVPAYTAYRWQEDLPDPDGNIMQPSGWRNWQGIEVPTIMVTSPTLSTDPSFRSANKKVAARSSASNTSSRYSGKSNKSGKVLPQHARPPPLPAKGQGKSAPAPTGKQQPGKPPPSQPGKSAPGATSNSKKTKYGTEV